MVKRVLQFDEYLLLALCRCHRPGLTRLMRALTRVGDASTWTLLALVLLAVGGASRGYGLRMAAAALAATAVTQVFKRTCRRARPNSGIVGFKALAENPDSWSFPSGHTAAAVAVAFALQGAGANLGAFHAGLAAGIGTSRVYLGAHYPLDVAVGAAIGAACGVAIHLLLGV